MGLPPTPDAQKLGPGRTPDALPEPARAAAEDLLARLDRALPGRIGGFYVVGSACLGAFREGRSDVDFVVIAGGGLDPAELARLRELHLGRWITALVRDTALRGRWPLVCNGCYLPDRALARSPREVTPLAGYVAGRFGVGRRGAFDVNPVTWHTLARRGVALRGPDPDRLEIRTDLDELRDWTLENLRGYWSHWVEQAQRGGPGTVRALPRRFAAWGVLGVTRLHYTLGTGEIASKETAGVYALEAFDARWQPVIEDALAFWRGGPPAPAYRRHPGRRRRDAAGFVAHVIDTGRSVAGSGRA